MMRLQNLNDRDLFSLIDQGRDDAFAMLLDRYYDTLFAFAFKYCRNRQDAEDVLQEALLKISRSFHTFDREKRFTTWAYRIVINTAKDLMRKESRLRDKHQAFAVHEKSGDNGAGTPLEDNIWELLDRLPKKLYDAVVLVYGQGLNHAEAAVSLGCAETTVSWRLHRARKMLSARVRRLGLVLLALLCGGERWVR